MLRFLHEEVTGNLDTYRDTVSDNIRVISPKDSGFWHELGITYG
jgi:hypothetical protein